MTVSTFTDLSGLKEANIEELSSIGITTLEQLRDAISDDSKVKEVIKTLSGVGPKTVENWKKSFEEGVEVAATAVPAASAMGHQTKIKPELSAEDSADLIKRDVIEARRPAFKRQEWFRYQKLGDAWRRPKGIHSKMRRGIKRRPPMANVGFGGPVTVRGRHPSGFEEVLVYNPGDLEGLDPKIQAARIGGTVGMKKRIVIEDRAVELGIRVLNRTV